MKRIMTYRCISFYCVLAIVTGLLGGQYTFRKALADESTYVNPAGILVTAPRMNSEKDSVLFSVENLTAEDKQLTMSMKSYVNGRMKEENEYSLALKTGTEKTLITLPANVGDVISIYDEQGIYYYKSIELGVKKWVATWASAQQSINTSRSEYPPYPGLMGNTLRQVIRISNGGIQFRLKFSNEYGTTPLELNSVHIAKPVGFGDSSIDITTDKTITFNGRESVTVPAGQIVTSDAINYDLKDLDRLAVTTCFGAVPYLITSHTGARTTTFLIAGNHVSDAKLATTTKNEVWYFLSSIDVLSDSESEAVACIGDSITDGRGVTINHDNRWTDILANRLQANSGTTDITVLNQGIGGNAVFGGLGPAAYLRFQRDVLEQQGVGYTIVFEGINDIGNASNIKLADRIIGQYKSFIEQAHAKGIKIFGATITPFRGYPSYYNTQYGPVREQIRQKINEWIRTSGNFDGVIDFDAAIRDPYNPEYISVRYDSGDGLHPNAAGYQRMGDAIDLSLFEDE